MVGGLVKHQQVGLHHQELGKVGTHDPAARELTSGLIEGISVKAKARKNFLSLRLKLVAVSSVESVLRGVILRAVGITGSIALTHDADSFGEFRGDADGYF